jgi:hypothetical protein
VGTSARYAWACGLCDATFPVEQRGYYSAQQHQQNEHAGQHGVIRGIVDLDSGEVVLPGFGPRVLAKAQKEGLVPVSDREGSRGSAGGGGGGGGRGSGERQPSNVRPAGVGIRTKQLFREVPLDLPFLEPLFQRCVQKFGLWSADDQGFSAWLHDSIGTLYAPETEYLWMDGEAAGSADPVPALDRAGAAATCEAVAGYLRDSSLVADSEMWRIGPAVTELVRALHTSMVWSSHWLPHLQRRTQWGKAS